MRKNTAAFKWLLALVLMAAIAAPADAQKGLTSPQTRQSRLVAALKEQVRHQLVMMPYYSVFDWLEFDVKPDGTVTLMGEVTRPSLKEDARSRIEKLEGVAHVIDN